MTSFRTNLHVMTKTHHGSTRKQEQLIQEKNVAFKNYCNNSSNTDLKCHLKYLQTSLNVSIKVTKEKYHIKNHTNIILVSINNFLN